MQAIETRLSGRQASLAGITRAINQQLGHGPLARVELRYSTQAQLPLSSQAAKQAIANLLREHGHGSAAVSVRAHEGPIDDATGEHVLRLLPAEGGLADGGAIQAQAMATQGWRSWLLQWLPRWLGGRACAVDAFAARVDPAMPVSKPVTPAAPATPALPPTHAVAKLRQAVIKGTSYVETDTGTAIVGGRAGGGAQVVGEARVIVRLLGLHLVLESLVKRDPAAIAAMVRSAGLVLASDFNVSYQFQPSKPGDGTGYANESDVEVRLIAALASKASRPTLPASTATAFPARTAVAEAGTLRPNSARTDLGTAMPGLPLKPAAVVRVVGTLDQPFEKPFDLPLPTLPARFDRKTLEAAGFDRAHPGLLSVASNSCPLTVSWAAGGGLQVHAAARDNGQGGHVAMYHRRDNLEAIVGDQRWQTTEGETDGIGQLVVNSPEGVMDPQTGRCLPALVIEVLPGGEPTMLRVMSRALATTET